VRRPVLGLGSLRAASQLAEFTMAAQSLPRCRGEVERSACSGERASGVPSTRAADWGQRGSEHVTGPRATPGGNDVAA